MKKDAGEAARIEHIWDSIINIENFIADYNLESFSNDRKTFLAIIKLLEIIGEASNHISTATLNKIEGVNWKSIIALRNIITHEYFGIDSRIIFEIATVDIPSLKQKLIDSGLVDHFL